MKKFQLAIIACFSVCIANAQQGSVSAGGEAVSGANGTVSYSIGQVAYSYAGDGSHSVSEGVQQPYEISVVTSNNEISGTISYNVYPNPTVSGVNLAVSENTGDMNVQLFDTQGKLIAEQKINSSVTSIPMEKLATGTYLLSVSTNKKINRTFRIVKNK